MDPEQLAIIGGGFVAGLVVVRLVPRREMPPRRATLWATGISCLAPLALFIVANILFRIFLFPRGEWDNLLALIAAIYFSLASLAGLVVGALVRRK